VFFVSFSFFVTTATMGILNGNLPPSQLSAKDDGFPTETSTDQVKQDEKKLTHNTDQASKTRKRLSVPCSKNSFLMHAIM
jgi:hypothetical protein